MPDNSKSDFERETETNERIFKELLKKVRPDLWVLMDILDETKLDPFILWKVARQLNNIAIGNNYGQVNIYIEKGVVTFVRGEEADKLNLPLVKK